MATTDAQQESLKKLLEDIQQPALPEQFYLPPGYLLLGLLLGGCLFVLFRWWTRRRQQQKPRRLALEALKQLRLALATSNAPMTAHSNAVVVLLKQYIQTKAPAHPALSQSGHQFLQFLQQSVSPVAPLPDAEWLLYSGQADVPAVTALFDFAAAWLQQHPESALHV